MSEQLGGVVIGAREIYDQVVGLRSDMSLLTQSHQEVSKTLDEHSARLTELEQHKWRASGAAAAVGAVVGVVVPFIAK